MIARFNKTTLLEKIIPLLGTVSTKNTIPSIEGILIETLDDGSVRLSSYDMNKGMRTYLHDVSVIEHGSYVINANRFIQYVKVMPEEEVLLEVDKNLNAKISSGSSSFSLYAIEGSEFPSLPELIGDKGFRIKEKILKKMIEKVIHSIAVQETRPMLCGAYFEVTKDYIRTVSCDSFTLSLCETKCEISDIGRVNSEEYKFIIPGHALTEILRHLNDKDVDIDINLTRKHAIICFDDIIFFTRLIDSEYVKYENLIPKDQTIFVNVSRERLLDGLERAYLIAEEKVQGSLKSYVKFVVKGDKLNISSTSVNGCVFDEMECEHTGDDIEIGFNCRYILNSIRATEGEQIKIALKSERQSATIEPSNEIENYSFLYLVLPVKMN